MPKPKRKKKSHNGVKSSATHKSKTVATEFIESKTSFRKKIYLILNKTAIKIIFLASLVGAYPTYKFIVNELKSPEQTFHDEMFIPGILLPEKLTSLDDKLFIKTGSFVQGYPISQFMNNNGLNYTPTLVGCSTVKIPMVMTYRIMNNRIYVSCVLKDLEHKEVVGILKDNRWEFFKSNILTFNHNDRGLEVLDKQNNVVLSLSFQDSRTILLQGYFIKDNNVCVMADALYPCNTLGDKKSMDSIIKFVQKIKRINF